MHPTRSYALDCCRLAGREGFRRLKFRFQGVASGWRGVVRNPLLGSLGDNFKMRVKGITGHRYVSHSTVSVDGRRRRSSKKNCPLCPLVMRDFRPSIFAHDCSGANETQPFTRSHDHRRSHDHAQTHHFRDTRSIRHLSPRKDPSSTKTKPFVAVRPKLKPPRICCLLIGWGWRPVNKCALLALLSLI